jgi:hypothetical protein
VFVWSHGVTMPTCSHLQYPLRPCTCCCCRCCVVDQAAELGMEPGSLYRHVVNYALLSTVDQGQGQEQELLQPLPHVDTRATALMSDITGGVWMWQVGLDLVGEVTPSAARCKVLGSTWIIRAAPQRRQQCTCSRICDRLHPPSTPVIPPPIASSLPPPSPSLLPPALLPPLLPLPSPGCPRCECQPCGHCGGAGGAEGGGAGGAGAPGPPAPRALGRRRHPGSCG